MTPERLKHLEEIGGCDVCDRQMSEMTKEIRRLREIVRAAAQAFLMLEKALGGEKP